MFERGVEEEVRRRARAAALGRLPAHVIGLSEVAALPRDEAVAAIVRRTLRYAAYQRKWLRRIPGVVSLSADRPAEEIAVEVLEVARARQRLPAGERADAGGPLDPASSRGFATSTRGSGRTECSRCVSVGGATAEIVIWNPDGSTAELSGNGTRIAARWLARRSGRPVVRIRVGERRSSPAGRRTVVEQEMGGSRSPSPRTSGRGREVEVTPVVVGNPHAVVRREPEPRGAAAARPAPRAPCAFPRADERPAHPRGRDARRHRGGLGAGRGGDDGLRHERLRRRGGGGRERLVPEPGRGRTCPGGELDGDARRRKARASGRPGPGDLPRRGEREWPEASGGPRAERAAPRPIYTATP